MATTTATNMTKQQFEVLQKVGATWATVGITDDPKRSFKPNAKVKFRKIKRNH
tara:strand:- start:28221 stop:28379 length:159 start_codon:yes stop_codon:yes gene_type:complete